MRGRCNTPTNRNFPAYGGRGISVCKEWGSYEAFREWALSNCYSDALTLDRIDNDGNYEPNNCRWATYSQQARNTRRNIVISYGGEALPLVAWAERTGLPYAMLRSRYRMGWKAAEILGKVPRVPPARRHPGRKIGEREAIAIKESSLSGVELSKRYGVSRALVSKIRNGLVWGRLPPRKSVDEIQPRKSA
jgi:hypothetical protein